MSYPVYYVPAGDVIPVLFPSFAGSTGASITLTGLAVTDIEIYKDGGTTQRASDAGYTLLDTDGIDFDGITGIHGFSIDTGDNTDASFYTVGSWFHVVVSAVTIDAQTVNFIACAFRLMAAETVAAKPEVVVATNNDKTNYTIAAGGIDNASFTAGAIDAAAIAASAIGASEIATGAIDADALAADAVDEIWDELVGDSTLTARQVQRILVAGIAGILSGAATTTITIRNVANSTDVIVATVDADGNRSAITLTP